MTNLFLQRAAWLRAVRMLAVCFVMMLVSVVAGTNKATAQGCDCPSTYVNCQPWSTEIKVRVTIASMPDCPLIVTIKVRSCEDKVGLQYYDVHEVCFSKIENENFCCATTFYNWSTDPYDSYIPELVDEVSDALIAENPMGFPATDRWRISKPSCWKWDGSDLSYKACNSTPCCYVERPAGGGAITTGPTPTNTCPPIAPPNPCKFVCP